MQHVWVIYWILLTIYSLWALLLVRARSGRAIVGLAPLEINVPRFEGADGEGDVDAHVPKLVAREEEVGPAALVGGEEALGKHRRLDDEPDGEGAWC